MAASQTKAQVNAGDIIRINDILITVKLGDGAKWPTPAVQPVFVTVSITHDISEAAETDNLGHSINYSSICSAIVTCASAGTYGSLEDLWQNILKGITRGHPEIHQISLKLTKGKPPLHCRSTGLEAPWSSANRSLPPRRYFIDGLECYTIIGVNSCEREEAQLVRFKISIEESEYSDTNDPFDFRTLTRRLCKNILATSFTTLEALASFVASETLHYARNSLDVVTVSACKPDALVLATSAEVSICRNRANYPRIFNNGAPSTEDVTGQSAPLVNKAPSLRTVLPKYSPKALMKIAALALGSNMGDRFANIELALRLLESPKDFLPSLEDAEVAIIDTSFMYETAPMYVEDQSVFINCACLIETNLDPRTLLELVKKIEVTVGRVPSIRNGPRAVDLDILMFDSEILDTRPENQRQSLDNLEGELVVPHPRIAEREFVLRPLNDILPNFLHPTLGVSVQTLLKRVHDPATTAMRKVVPFPQYPVKDTPSSNNLTPPTATYWSLSMQASGSCPPSSHKTHLMATLNATPDSFSDGSAHNALPAALKYVNSSVAAGADIIDIGGYSTRPGAAYVSPDEETSRVVPIIQGIRNLDNEARNALISVDTFRADVAKSAVLAGANCINDVYAFTGPEYPLNRSSVEHLVNFRQIVRELGVPVVLMHSRGDAGANKDYVGYDSSPDNSSTLEGIKAELGEKVDAIVKGRNGLRRWLVIIDPGIGFSKSLQGNLDILRHAASITADDLTRYNPLAGFPQLIGPSRKSFLGAILSQADPGGKYEGRQTEPKERGWATAAAVASAVQQGAAVVRVHDVLEMGDVVRVLAAIYSA